MRAAIWAAVSSEVQAADDKASIPNQLAMRCDHATYARQHLDGTSMNAHASYKWIVRDIEAAFKDLQDEDARAEILARQQEQGIVNVAEQLAAIDGRIKQLKESQKKIDLDYYVNNKIDDNRHELLTVEIEKQLSVATQQRTALAEAQKHHEAQSHLAERLVEIANEGIDRLHSPNSKASNAWLRQYIKVYIRNRKVSHIEYLF